jgi:hypothetical protein
VAGGKQTVHTAGLNWYVNRNVRFMFNYLYGDIAKRVSATNVGDVGAKFDAFAVRTCACRKSNTHIQMMKSAKKWLRQNATNGMYCSRRRRVLVD